MIDYVIIEAGDRERSQAFFCGLLPKLGTSHAFDVGGGQFYGFREGSFLGVFPRAASGQRRGGPVIALRAPSEEQVREACSTALLLGANCTSSPQRRDGCELYSGFFQDPDGNSFCIYSM